MVEDIRKLAIWAREAIAIKLIVFVIILVCLQNKANCQQKESRATKQKLNLNIEDYFPFDSLQKINCKELPGGVYSFVISISNGRYSIESKNRDYAILDALLIAAIKSSLNANKLKNGTYIQLIYFEGLLTGACKVDDIPDNLTTNDDSWQKEKVDRYISEKLKTRQKNIDDSIKELEKIDVEDKLIFLKFAYVVKRKKGNFPKTM
jgi:hypothetical protein